MLTNQTSSFNRFILEPIREVYEAFVIYTFFSLLTDMLGGEKNIIIMTSGREPVSHPGFLYWLPKIDMSDPKTFLSIKRGILQYVWLKPFICFGTIFFEAIGVMDTSDMSWRSLYFWLTLVYNFSVSLSLYSLAIFWKTLWNDLKPFSPVGKFLCVKLIIFASYWQGMILAFLNFFQLLPKVEGKGSIGLCIQNGLLCVELIFFAIGHFVSFSYVPFTLKNMPSGRLQFKYALRDTFGIKDLIYDFKLTFHGDYYKDFREFDSVDALISHPDSNGRMSRINQGLRYQSNGKQKHWIRNAPANSVEVRSTSEIQTESPISQGISAFGDMNSLKSGASTRGLYQQSVDSISPPPLDEDILDSLKLDPELSGIDYEKELLDEDEIYYSNATSIVNNYKLDQVEIRRLLNYPIVDELLDSHAFGYKVSKLRRERMLRRDEQTNYGSTQEQEHGA